MYPVKCNAISRLVSRNDHHTDPDNDRSDIGRMPIGSTSGLSEHKSKTPREAEFTGQQRSIEVTQLAEAFKVLSSAHSNSLLLTGLRDLSNPVSRNPLSTPTTEDPEYRKE